MDQSLNQTNKNMMDLISTQIKAPFKCKLKNKNKMINYIINNLSLKQ